MNPPGVQRFAPLWNGRWSAGESASIEELLFRSINTGTFKLFWAIIARKDTYETAENRVGML